MTVPKRADSLRTKPCLPPLLVVLGLAAATTSAWMPALSCLDLPSQTKNGFTAQLESYYADTSRLVFVVRINSDQQDYLLDASIERCARPGD